MGKRLKCQELDLRPPTAEGLARTQARDGDSTAASGLTRWLAPPTPWNLDRLTEYPMNEMRLLDPFSMDPLEDTFRSMLRPWRLEQMDSPPRIRLDVAERNGTYAVRAEIPGCRKEDIDVRIEGNLVTISAEMKKVWDDSKDGRLLRSERQYGYATRSFTLSSAVDESKADAKYENGVLELTLPKKSASSTKRLSIH